ncbi:MAG: N4-gp56 family major capsid protein [Smithella sp.]|jgi:N4-gp56 family major capsid protein
MALNSMLSPAQRIGKIKGEILTHAIPREVLGIIGDTRPFPKNSGDTIIFRRWLPMNATVASPNTFFTDGTGDRTQALANTYLASEGVTPNAETLVPQDITVTLHEYTVLFGYTKRTADLYEDDVPSAMKLQTGERLALVRELVRYNQIKACTNKFYGGTGTTRATVNGKLTLALLRKITKSLDVQHTDKVTEILSASPKYGTSGIEASYFVFIHTDLKPDVRDIPGFTPVARYGSMKPVSPYEFGSIEEFRIIASPELACVQDSGALVGSTGLASTNDVNIDVYQVVVAGRDAWGDVALRGAKSFEIHDLKPGQIDKNDPTGQRGYMGASCYYNAVLLNSLHMAVAEVGATDL